MFIHNLHEDTKNYLKTLLVEEDASTGKKGGKKPKDKKEEKKDEKPVATDTAVPAPVADSAVVVEPAKTSLSPEEQKIKEANQKAAEERERQLRNIQQDSGKDTPETIKYKENVRRTSSGPVPVEGPTESGSPVYGYGPSGRGRGAPAPTGEPEDRTGIKQSTLPAGEIYRYNFPVLLGKSLENVSGYENRKPGDTPDPLRAVVIEPYQDLQRIKVLRSISPAILQKLSAIGQVEAANLKGTSLTPIKGEAPTGWNANAGSTSDKQQVLIDIGVLPQNSPISLTDAQINAAYDTASKKINTKSSGKDFMSKVRQHAGALSGLGGLDPFFGEELAAKLLGGEWVEKAMQNIAPAQERGVISSMGNRSSIGM